MYDVLGNERSRPVAACVHEEMPRVVVTTLPASGCWGVGCKSLHSYRWFPSLNSEHVSHLEGRWPCRAFQVSGLEPGSYPCRGSALAASTGLSFPGVSVLGLMFFVLLSPTAVPRSCPWEGCADHGLPGESCKQWGTRHHCWSWSYCPISEESVVHVFLGNPNTAEHRVGWHPRCCSWWQRLSCFLLSST